MAEEPDSHAASGVIIALLSLLSLNVSARRPSFAFTLGIVRMRSVQRGRHWYMVDDFTRGIFLGVPGARFRVD